MLLRPIALFLIWTTGPLLYAAFPNPCCPFSGVLPPGALACRALGVRKWYTRLAPDRTSC